MVFKGRRKSDAISALSRIRLACKSDGPVYTGHLIDRWIPVAGRAVRSGMGRSRGLGNSVQPIFVVGCGHSGTTLMASMVADHSGVLGIGEETGVFLRSREYMLGAIDQWGTLARQLGNSAFVEKTPIHVRFLGRMLRYVPNCRVVYIVREPRDNVSSLFERYGNLEAGVIRYIKDNLAGLDHVGDERVLMCRYEDLVSDTEGVKERVYAHCRVSNSRSERAEWGSVYSHWSNVEGNKSVRASQVALPIYDRRGRWRDVLDYGEAERVLEATKGVAGRLGYGFREKEDEKGLETGGDVSDVR